MAEVLYSGIYTATDFLKIRKDSHYYYGAILCTELQFIKIVYVNVKFLHSPNLSEPQAEETGGRSYYHSPQEGVASPGGSLDTQLFEAVSHAVPVHSQRLVQVSWQCQGLCNGQFGSCHI